MLLPLPFAAFAEDYPTKPVELVVPASAGGGTDALARGFAELAKKHLPQPLIVNDKPGASGVVGMSDVLNNKPDGYKVSVVIAELVILPHLNLAKFTYADFRPIARLNADPSAITVKADAPWNTIEEFLAAAKAKPGEMKVGNSGNGSIWHLAAAGLEDKTGVKFNHVPYQGAAPGVVALLGGHIDAVAVSPGEVATHVQAGKLKMLAVMADQRLKAFDKVPTLKERKIDLSIGTWRGLAVPKATPTAVVDVLRTATRKTAEEPAMREVLEKLNLGFSYLDAAEFGQAMERDHEYFKQLVQKVGIKS
ncbi:tripartite tricarboxylate transporter substrate binding protein [Variovorax sp. J22G21]|uniref:tripartite tricarboxylate transporter substrate binding protein n=1 Tax=Variovorax fucosicus TaxID=3053517 RepID=UPI0025787243|nr:MULTISPECIES: tripartite tricarboxylate transporter substrate binding protein [unclassified Variovorax]MDM0040825.1 tripartite tricarboxylate transporter substrate binding protein [Variovorax sp. J22R193]MDM0059542.1 tripartite tricarboxylate transporter substrate binding protein [Variovorax sp. J22G47]MDM0064767.1 tripartite tricarboxylate transporter substrate binding protein [Variovorax sp. J22G21]